MEQHTSTIPVSVTNYKVRRLAMDWTDARIEVVVIASNGDKLAFQYLGAQATSLMTALNKANLSVLSLHARILNQLAADGKLPAGNVTGAPD